MKYTLDIAALFVSPSDDELKALSESAGVVSNMNSLSDTLFGDALKRSITASDSAVNEASALKNRLMSSTASATTNNSVIKQLDAAEAGGIFTGKMGDFVNKAVTGVDLTAFALTAIIDCNNFSYQYNNKSKTAVRALKGYCPGSLLREFGWTGSIESYLKDIEAETGTAFIAKKLAVEDVLPKLNDSVMSSGSLVPAAVLFAGWNFLAGVLPPIKNSIDSADNFQLTNHAVYYQDDSQELQLKALASCFFPDHIDEEKLLAASDSAFTYLKFCYIARSNAVASLQLNFLADSDVKSTALTAPR